MSIEVRLPQLAETVRRYAFAYLLTVGTGEHAHVVAVAPVVRDGMLLVSEPGRRTARNVAAAPAVTLVWPPADPTGYALIVDGVGGLRADALAVRPTRAVLHRAATPAEPAAGCGSDCVEVAVPVAEG